MPRAKFLDSWDFSFSGIKTDLARRLHRAPATDASRARLAASYQEAIVRVLVDRVMEVAAELGGYPVVVVGGVARNRRLRALLTERAGAVGQPVSFPDPNLCTDNAAMIAAAGAYKLSIVGSDGEAVDAAANLPLTTWNLG